ncbi:hypothetical protein ACFW81_14460 [Streptomyces angustmyceticus]|uniref:hypothetical protein n=1 Tax=Streptomyces angustmyceticus TaxID=285578 RepID=UPI003683FD0C
MRIRTFVGAVILLAGLAGITGCGQNYEEQTEACLTALKARADGDKAKPAECAGIKRSDYVDLVMSVAIDDLGWTDEDGRFDKNKMLDSLTEDGK